MSAFSFPPFYRDYVKFVRQTQEIEKALGIGPAYLELQCAMEHQREILEAQRALEAQRGVENQRELLEQIQFQKDLLEWSEAFVPSLQRPGDQEMVGQTAAKNVNGEDIDTPRGRGRPSIKLEIYALLNDRVARGVIALKLNWEARELIRILLARRKPDRHGEVPKLRSMANRIRKEYWNGIRAINGTKLDSETRH